MNEIDFKSKYINLIDSILKQSGKFAGLGEISDEKKVEFFESLGKLTLADTNKPEPIYKTKRIDFSRVFDSISAKFPSMVM